MDTLALLSIENRKEFPAEPFFLGWVLNFKLILIQHEAFDRTGLHTL